jgi:hypothetical protein
MRKVERSEIVDYQTYGDVRAEFQKEVFAVKEPRRIEVGDALCFLFENHTTVRYQVQEMMRTERIVRDADIQHELDTYNEVLGDDGELGCTLLIGIDDPARRDVLLREWLRLPEHLYALLDDGTKVRARYDARQVGETRLSSVQYLKFDTKGRVPVALGSDLPTLPIEAALTDAQRAALSADLGEVG